jgi:hypothetical protein
LLLRKKAAEELKKEQERKAAERRRIIEERCGKPKNVDDASEGNVFAILITYLLNYILFHFWNKEKRKNKLVWMFDLNETIKVIM